MFRLQTEEEEKFHFREVPQRSLYGAIRFNFARKIIVPSSYLRYLSIVEINVNDMAFCLAKNFGREDLVLKVY